MSPTWPLLFSLFLFYVPVSGVFEFGNLGTVHRLIIAAIKETQCSCIAILRSPDEDVSEKSAIDRITISLAQEFELDHGFRRPTVMSYTTELYTKFYMSVHFRKADTCIYWITVVMVSDKTAKQLSQLSTSHFFHHPFWLLIANRTNHSEIFKNVQLKLSTRLYLFNTAANETYTLNRLYIDGSTFSEKVTWQNSTKMHIEKLTPSDIRINVTVGVLEHVPYLTVNRTKTGHVASVSGLYGEIWKILEDALNFTSVFIEPPDQVFGSFQHGTWTGLYGLLTRKQVDILLSDLTISESRHHVVDFLHAIEKSKYKIFYKKGAETFDLLKAFRPFHRGIWLVLLAWILIGGTIAYILRIFERKLIQSGQQYSLISCFYFILQTLSNQGSEKVPQLWALRALFLTAYLLASLILPSYSAALITALTVKTTQEPFSKLTDIPSTDYKISLVPDTTDYDFFDKSTDPVLKNIAEESILSQVIKDYPSAIQIACDGYKTVFFGTIDELTAAYRQQKMGCTLIPLKSEISPAYKTIIAAKHSQYQTGLKKELLKMLEYGLVNRYRRLYMPKGYEEAEETDISIGLIDVGGVFIYFLLMLSASFVIFCFENLLPKKSAQ